MNRFMLLLPLALLTTVPHAQQSKNRVGILNVQTVVKAMPGAQAYLDLNARASSDLAAKQKNIQALAAKASTAADRAALTKAQQAYAAARTDYAKRIDAAFKPLGTKMNAAVAKVARANGYTVVLDERVAAQTSLIVYANEGATNLNNAVLKELK
ncbi:OmpH family outer membrane protein [Deinococcus sp. 6GRE01]|uniref:OmpH family outer membrane protein n=1 Tax=Deinococcus sp. 6GRE01 TaxID=2745873 RepID=UPI001E44B6A9|nr:OmpH family outer membrane protein [Deinococcus sp. 6GRE01]MCD0158190.1 OmpH family outer membrane protein [Deinococcus sp. 6GRE01]